MSEALTWLAGHATPGAALRSDSRTVAAGDVFFAYPGDASDGRRYIDAAVSAGAVAILAEAQGLELTQPCAVPLLAVPNLKAVAGSIAAQFHGHPSQHMAVVGITGTSGKTTTSQWLAQALNSVGTRCGVIGTLGAGFPGELTETGFTTPQAVELQGMLADLHRQGSQAVAMEVSSIGLAEDRLAGCHFDTAVFTNLSHEHLDYHGDMTAYEAAKARLFAWPQLRVAVINADDAAGRRLLHSTAARPDAPRCVHFGIGHPAEALPGDGLTATDIEWAADGARFRMHWGHHVQAVFLPAFGLFNVSNALAVAAVLLTRDIPLPQVAECLAALPMVEGRLNALGGDGLPLVIVDYAHKPDALDKVLVALRPVAEQRGGKLVCVFGCGGDRDPSKRAVMARIASERSDVVVVTSDNPRNEEPLAIIGQIMAGVPGHPGEPGFGTPILVQIDRSRAIACAVTAAKPADVVLVAGKGHEAYQEIKGEKLPFSDAEQVRAALHVWGHSAC